MLVSVHVPKCGGISFQHVLRGIFGKKLWLNYGAFTGREGARYELIPRGTLCVHGHFKADTFDDLVPQPELVTWFRHPVDRVVSAYYHFLRHDEPGNASWRALTERGLSLEQFAELEGMRNEAAQFLAGKPLSSFRFVGVMERYVDSLRLFGEAFGVRVPAVPPLENVNPRRVTDHYPISRSTYDHILALNSRDLVLYEAALAGLREAAADRLG
ncbi:MAG TPA: hypothetical protein VHC86_03650 [Opitutaceae bacterium]|nr:hypothetical protein [Opitutaceae bacterium]